MYEMQWSNRPELDLSRYIVAAAPFGGPIALFRDDRVLLELHAAESTKALIEIFSSSGQCICSFDQGRKNRVIGMGWTGKEELIVSMEDGNVLMYDIHGKFIKSFNMGGKSGLSVQEMRMCPKAMGIVVMTVDWQFFGVASCDDPKPRKFAEYPMTDGERSPATSWTILSNDRSLRILVCADAALYLIDYPSCLDLIVGQGQLDVYVAMAVAPDGDYIALFTADGILRVFSTDFQKNIVEVDTGDKRTPYQLLWCGSDAVVVYWDMVRNQLDFDSVLLVVSPTGNFIDYSYPASLHLVQEIDGLRIFSDTKQEFIERVPDQIVDIFSTSLMSNSGAALNDACVQFNKQNPGADDLIRKLKNDPQDPEALVHAIEMCIQAAGYEFDVEQQRGLLKAARFGMDFVDASPGPLIQMCQWLRVLFHVRDFRVGIALTYRQLLALSIETLIDRLINRGIYWLAFEICKYLKLSDSTATNRVLVHWASSMVMNQDADDDAIAKTIIRKIGDTKGISYTEIARSAITHGRRALAISLLNNESRASDQVPLLLQIEEDELALTKALESGDPNLAYVVIMHLKDKLHQGDFLRIMDTKPVARDLLIQYCRENDPDMLKAFCVQQDHLAMLGNIFIQEAYKCESVEEALVCLRESKSSLASKEAAFIAKAVDQQTRLLDIQRKLEKQFQCAFINLSVTETIFELIAMEPCEQQEGIVNQIRKEFDVSERAFHWVKLNALVVSKQFLALETFSKNKSPIGYAPFVVKCIEANERFHAKKYIAKVAAPEQRVHLMIQLGMVPEAVEFAQSIRGGEKLLDIIQNETGRSIPELMQQQQQQAQPAKAPIKKK